LESTFARFSLEDTCDDPFHGALRRKGIGLVQDQVQRLAVLVVEPFRKIRHEPRLLAFSEMRQVEHHREAFFYYDVSDDLTGPHIEGHIAVLAPP